MDELFDEKVFSIGDDEYRWHDVVLAAHAWGDWAAFEGDVRHILTCVERLRESPDAPSDDELEDAANEFRYQRDLVSAEEMEAWLDAHALDADQWMEHILGVVSTQKCAGLADEIEPDPALSDEDVQAFLLVEAICGGTLDGWARKLAGRAAVAAAEQDKPTLPTEADADDATAEDASADQEAIWQLVGLEPDVGRDRLDRLARLDAAFAQFGQRVLTATAIREQVSARHLDWIRIHAQKVSFPSEAMAREALMCMKDDHQELADVAVDAGQALHEVQVYLEEMAHDFKDRFLGARRQDLIGPLATDSGFDLYRVLDKVLPSVNDAEIRERAELEILRRGVEREIADRVRWERRLD